MSTDQHPDPERLSDFAEGLLPSSERGQFEAHLAACAACREEVESIRGLRAGLAALPRELEPGADLRPQIRREAGVARRRARNRAALRDLRVPLAAAAATLVLATAGATALVVRTEGGAGGRDAELAGRIAAPPGGPGGVAGTAAGADGDRMDVDGVTLADFRRLESDYARAAEELLAALDGADVSAETSRLVRENLRTIDRALQESREALAREPGSPLLRQLVLAAHEQKLDVLRRAARLSARS